MKRKIVCILVMMLLISVAVSSVNGSMNTSTNTVIEKNWISSRSSTSCYQIEVLQNSILLGIVEPYTGPETGARNYGYSSASAHPNSGPTPVEWTSKLYFYDGSDGLSLGMFHNIDNNIGIGQVWNNVEWDIYVDPGPIPNPGVSVLLSDDDPGPGELSYSGGTYLFKGKWDYITYASGKLSNTDGGVIGEFTCGAEIDIMPISWGVSGEITSWDIYSGDGSSIPLNMNLDTHLVVTCNNTCAWSGNSIDTYAIIGPIDFSSASDPVLDFLTIYDLQSGSYVTLYISINGGIWDFLAEFSGYKYCCYLETFDLSAYIGHRIRLMFMYHYGTGQVGEGFFIDNITIYELSLPTVFYSEDFSGYSIGDKCDPSGTSTSPWTIVGLEMAMIDPSSFLYLFSTKTNIPTPMPVMVGGIVVSVEATDLCCCNIIEVRFYVDGVLKATDTSAPYDWLSGLDFSQWYFQKKTIKVEVVTSCCIMVEEITVCCLFC